MADESNMEFPNDKEEYFFRCRIHEIENAKEDYDLYNHCLIDNISSIPPFK